MKLIFFLIFFSCLTPIYCQTDNIKNNIWISGGLGFYNSGDYSGISLYSSLNWSRIKSVIKNSGTFTKNTNLEIRFIYNTASLGEDNFENLNEFGLLYGKSIGKVLQLTISGGLGVVKGYQAINYINPHIPDYVDNSLTLGIPLELGINLVPGKNFGLAIDWYANLNSKNNITGFVFKLLLGKIR